MSDDSNEYREHLTMWSRFVKLTACTTAGVVVTLALMAVFLT